MSVSHFSPVRLAQRSKLVRRRQTSWLACLVALAGALWGCVLPQAANADGPFALSKVAQPSSVCPEGGGGRAECLAIRVPTVPASSADATGPDLEGSGELGGLDPKDLREAYKLPETGGSSQTVALIDAFNDPYAESDLQKYREKYKVYFKGAETACTETNDCFKKVNQKGENTNYPENESGWAGEISLDVDMVSAACPECHILLVEATNEELSNLLAANEEAAKLKATEISNSWGYLEFSGETSDDKYLDHPGILTFAAAGDVQYDGCDHKLGAGICYPAASQYVIAVGGTKLKKEPESSRKWTEEVWKEESRSNGTGSGCSKYEPKPPGQKELSAKDSYCEHRLDNDVAADAAVESAVSVYDTYYGGWEDFGGTSASSPFVAGVEAHATSATQLLGANAFYKKPSMLFDVTKGNNGTCTPPAEDEYFCTAEVGYDGPTGEGTPDNVFESTAPAGATGFATKVESTGATLNGIVNPNGGTTKYYFEYGTTESYGTKTAEVSVGSGTSNLEESKAITGLAPETTYHFRIVTTSSIGTTYGLDQVFSTSTPIWSIQPTSNPFGLATNKLAGTSCASSSACVAVGWYVNGSSVYDAAAETWNGTEWVIHNPAVPSGATLSSMDGVSCSSSTACTGVGDYTNSSGTNVTLAERWNGTEWTIQSTPNPSGATRSLFTGVSCSSATACTATGEYVNSSGTTVTLAEAWNGTEWSIQSTSNPSEASGSTLQSVYCASSSSCVAIGYSSTSTGWESFSEQWNGTTWTLKSLPEASGAAITITPGMSCTSASACTAVGYAYSPTAKAYLTVAERWNGTEWKVQTTPTPSGAEDSYLRTVSCSSSTSCIATGEYVNSSGTTVTLAETWNGTEWKVQTPPNPTGAKESILRGVLCTSSTACTTVGWYVNSQGITTNLVQRWNGTEWSIQSASNPSGLATNKLFAVSCSSSTACLSVGWYVNSSDVYDAAAETWNGTEWVIHNPAVPSGATLSSMDGVSCSSSTACTAVGAYMNSSGTIVTLAERWNGTEWTIQSTPNPSGATRSTFTGVSCSSATACTATGEYVNSSGTTVTLAEAWNGTEWSIQSTSNPSEASGSTLQSVYCASSSSCVAIGYSSTSTGWESFSEQWNGTTWTLKSLPEASEATITITPGMSCTSASACTAVGYSYSGSVKAYLTVAERWNGTEWKVQSTPNPSGAEDSYLRAVSCSSSTSCVATGEYVNSSGTTVTLAERWNGTGWKVQTPPNPTGAKESILRGVSCTSSTACTTVGWYVNSQGITTNLVEAY